MDRGGGPALALENRPRWGVSNCGMDSADQVRGPDQIWNWGRPPDSRRGYDLGGEGPARARFDPAPPGGGGVRTGGLHGLGLSVFCAPAAARCLQGQGRWRLFPRRLAPALFSQPCDFLRFCALISCRQRPCVLAHGMGWSRPAGAGAGRGALPGFRLSVVWGNCPRLTFQLPRPKRCLPTRCSREELESNFFPFAGHRGPQAGIAPEASRSEWPGVGRPLEGLGSCVKGRRNWAWCVGCSTVRFAGTPGPWPKKVPAGHCRAGFLFVRPATRPKPRGQPSARFAARLGPYYSWGARLRAVPRASTYPHSWLIYRGRRRGGAAFARCSSTVRDRVGL